MLTEKEANKGKLVSEKRQNLLGGEDTDFIDCAKGTDPMYAFHNIWRQ